MHIEQIDHYCDLFERRLKNGAQLSTMQFLREHHLPEEDGLVEELKKLEREYRPGNDVDPGADPKPRPMESDDANRLTASMPVEGVGALIGNYKLLQQIGEGGMGVVYMAEQTEPVIRRVALKIIKPGMDSKQVLARFEAERQALAMMDHPNIARVLDAGTTESGQPFFVMELVKGISVTKYSDDYRLTPKQRLDLFVPICHAVQHAHQKGVIHRDIKPSNILVAQYDDRAVPKIIDFGLAKAISHQLTERTMFTQFGQLVGTIDYMSPEQAKFNQLDVDTRTDIYSLGVLLYELLTGATPFDKKRLRTVAFDELLRIIQHEQPPRMSARLSTSATLDTIAANRRIEPRRLNLLVRRELDWIVMKALEKDRGRRYESASAFAADVERYLNDEPVEACPPTAGYRLRKFARRNKTVLSTAVLVTAALLIGTAVSIWQAVESNLARQAEARQRQRAEANLQRALEAVDRMLSRIGHDDLASVPHMGPVRLRLLEDALEFYEEFLKEEGSSPALEHSRAIAFGRAGSIVGLMNRQSQAEQYHRKAIEILEKLVRQFPSEARYRATLATSYSSLGWAVRWQRGEESQRPFQQAVNLAEELAAQDPQYRDLLGNVCCSLASALTNAEEAEPLFQRAMVLRERSPSVRMNYGRLLVTANRLDEAETQFRQAISLNEKQLAENPDDLWRSGHEHHLAETFLDLGRLLVRADRLEEAEATYRKATTLRAKLAADFPSVPEYHRAAATVYSGLVEVLMKRGKFQEAEQIVREMNPRTAEEYDQRAKLYQQLREYDKALADYDKALELDPETWSAYAGRSKLYLTLKQYDKALPDLLRLVNSHQYSEYWLNLLIATYVDLNQYDNALAELDKRIAANPGIIALYRSRAGLYKKTAEYDKALADYDKAVGLHPSSALAYSYRGAFYVNQLKEYEKALADLDKSLQLDPHVGWRYKCRALAHFKLGHFDKALADIAKAAELNPSDSSNLTRISPSLVAKCPDKAFRE